MPEKENPDHSKRSPKEGDGPQPARDFFRLLRYSHIFASAVREILELKLLREVSPLPLTLSQFHLLKLMSVNGQHQMGQLADFLGVSPPAATKNIDKLERLKLVVRTPSKGDRRATLLSVSPKGRRLVRKYEELKTERLTPVLDEFQPQEVEKLSELLERFSVSLLRIEHPGEEFCLRCAAYIADDCPVGPFCGGCPYQKGRAMTSNRGAAKETP
ncbi:MAG: MarR family transcriptional regulator [Candidatus Latescibacteria bacterium]|nr:MarR family transcriptional regulator [Candidatus Latescibacterota bacterium]NIM66337.1 MarR family transcriptional regulator [Candidatus Latescibacterota bacterium]NIO02816.1 MarR family transcriptional regulator [Candidatus Latescibacterota bacterium]NIO29951.1 MarR family transcriptional regulator [Candidatus Latescibacterota bacterium]NIO57566.1 MarR family transcriptional regulator [Candidatus Latescibacterota bacterium]